jgi:hypothetical protein
MLNKKIVLIVLVFFLLFNRIHGEINLGLNLSNNHWHQKWKTTISPEISYSSNWFWVGVDRTITNYEIDNNNDSYVLYSRLSLIPMLRAPLGNFFAAIGYGFSYTSRREEITEDNINYKITSSELYKGEIRGSFGVSLPVSSTMKFFIKSSYSYINKNNQFYSISTGISLSYYKKSFLKDTKKSITKNIIPVTQRIKKISFISNKDKIINELNNTIEVALIRDGYQIIRFDKIRDSVYQLFKSNQAEKLNKSNTIPLLEEMDDLDIALKYSHLVDVDVIIQTNLRYNRKSYGGEILVKSAYIQILNPVSGEILWATEYNAPDSPLIRCKLKLSSEVKEAIKKIKLVIPEKSFKIEEQ